MERAEICEHCQRYYPVGKHTLEDCLYTLRARRTRQNAALKATTDAIGAVIQAMNDAQLQASKEADDTEGA